MSQPINYNIFFLFQIEVVVLILYIKLGAQYKLLNKYPTYNIFHTVFLLLLF